MGKTYTSMRGKEVDMERLTVQHETTPAIGNMRVNARGDELGPGGKVIRTREQIQEEYYRRNNRSLNSSVSGNSKE